MDFSLTESRCEDHTIDVSDRNSPRLPKARASSIRTPKPLPFVCSIVILAVASFAADRSGALFITPRATLWHLCCPEAGILRFGATLLPAVLFLTGDVHHEQSD